jgi:hypothetical protein
MIDSGPRGLGSRIVLCGPSAVDPGWCWRPDWICGGESAYGLLGLFQLLNVIRTRALVIEFAAQPAITRRPREKVPTLDLYDPQQFDMPHLAKAMCLELDALKKAFLCELFQHSLWKGSPCLRWCPECIKSALHPILFQLPVVHSCPAHSVELLDRCPRCRTSIPYKLYGASTAVPLFFCHACKYDLLSEVRDSLVRPAPTPSVLEALAAETSVLDLCDRLPTITGGVLTGADARAYRELALSIPRRSNHTAGFPNFAKQVMASLAGKDSDNSLRPSYVLVEPRALRCKPAAADKFSCGWSRHLISPSDKRLIQAALVYRTVRRNLWRRRIYGHRQCTKSTCMKIWWPVVGSQTTALCPISTAFIRWRMFWEGTSVPTGLCGDPQSPPLGLIAWLGLVAPVGSASWSDAASNWLLKHVLGCELLASFDALLIQAYKDLEQDHIVWNRVALDELPRVGWVCAGKGSRNNPLRLYVMPNSEFNVEAGLSPGFPREGRQHWHWHQECLSRVEH